LAGLKDKKINYSRSNINKFIDMSFRVASPAHQLTSSRAHQFIIFAANLENHITRSEPNGRAEAEDHAVRIAEIV
jgi:hypothetical protein